MLSYVTSSIIFSVGLWAAFHVLLTKRNSKSAVSWVAVCLLLPVAGPIIYLIFGINRIGEKGDRKVNANLELTENLIPSEYGMYATVGSCILQENPKPCDDISILENGEALFPSMISEIQKAKQTVFISTYIFQHDSVGIEIANTLLDAKRRGVNVRLMIDGLGAIAYGKRILRFAKHLGLRPKLFNPVSLIPPSLHVNMRNHRKLLIVDGKTAFTGGQNISERHLVSEPQNANPTKDLHFRITGSIVTDLEYAFLRDWDRDKAESRRENPEGKEASPATSKTWARMILDGPNENLDKLNELLAGMFATATKRIWIMTAYFLPGLDLIAALRAAQLKGVEVKIVLPERTNIHLAHWASQHNLKYILNRELDVFMLPAPFVHSKAIVIDDAYSLIGSANIDPRSLRLNFELGVEVFSKEFNAKLVNYFHRQLSNAAPVTPEYLDDRPKLIQLRDALAWLFSPYL